MVQKQKAQRRLVERDGRYFWPVFLACILGLLRQSSQQRIKLDRGQRFDSLRSIRLLQFS